MNKESKFYRFDQNDSGGNFVVNELVCHRVIIEAMSEEEALAKFKPMIENQSASCPCCGDRWGIDYADEITLDKWRKEGYPVNVYSHYPNPEERWFTLYGEFPRLVEPQWSVNRAGVREFVGKIYFDSVKQYCQYLANDFGWTTPDVRIYYLNGSVKEIFSKRVKR